MTKYYLFQGKDGFECLVDSPVIVDHEDIPVLLNLVLNYFKTIKSLKKGKTNRFRGSVIPLIKVINIMNDLKDDPDVVLPPSLVSANDKPKLSFQSAATFVTKVLSTKRRVLTKDEKISIKKSEKFKEKLSQLENRSMKLEPKLENRIICVKDNQV